MKAALIPVGLFCLAMGALCFFGQLFVGKFLPTATLMGLSGFVAGAAGIGLGGGSQRCRRWALWGGSAGVAAVGLDVANYYIYLAIPGNYYAWFMFGPYAAALAFIAVLAAATKP